MAVFKYIGTLVKPNGKVDVKVPQRDGSYLVFEDVVPNVTTMDVGTDAYGILALENGADVFGSLVYERVS